MRVRPRREGGAPPPPLSSLSVVVVVVVVGVSASPKRTAGVAAVDVGLAVGMSCNNNSDSSLWIGLRRDSVETISERCRASRVRFRSECGASVWRACCLTRSSTSAWMACGSPAAPCASKMPRTPARNGSPEGVIATRASGGTSYTVTLLTPLPHQIFLYQRIYTQFLQQFYKFKFKF